jgi:hypothetical protein
MGNWNISIRGVGCHHNKNLKEDANRMAVKFVRDLKAAGHTIESAEITHGGKEDLLNPWPQTVEQIAAEEAGN